MDDLKEVIAESFPYLAMMFMVMVFGIVLTAMDRPASANPGTMCMHQSDCSEHEVCLADSDLSEHGHCARLRVLP